MAFNHGRVAVLKIDDSGGTLRDVSAYCTGCDLDQGVDIPDTTTFGNTTRQRDVVGLIDNKFTITGFFDPSATTGLYTVLSGLVGLAGTTSVEYGPAGSTGGYPKTTAEARMTSMKIGSQVDGVCSLSADFVVDGAVTYTTW